MILEPDDFERVGDDESLLNVVGRGDAFEDLQSLDGGSTSLGLVLQHASDNFPKESGGSAEMLVSLSGVEAELVVEVLLELHSVSEERT